MHAQTTVKVVTAHGFNRPLYFFIYQRPNMQLITQ